MEPSWLSLLIQVPLVGVFIWYSLEMNKRGAEAQKAFMDALEKRDSAFTERNRALIETMNTNNRALCESIDAMQQTISEHDRMTRDYIAAQPRRRT